MTVEAADSSRTLAARFTVGLLQGAALYVLTDISQHGTAPFINNWTYTSLVLISLLVPPVLLAGIASMRSTTLVAWSLTVAIVAVATAYHAGWREPGVDRFEHTWLVFPLACAVFVGHHLLAASNADGRLFARYATYFETGWRNGIQLALSLAFLGVFWLLLFLGASLFELINISFVREVIEKAPFAFIASTVVFALAVQITDERISLVTGARTIALLLLGWLLPVMTLFVTAFLSSLAFVGLTPLWKTGSATAILVVSGAALITLINATYQDGSEGHSRPFVLRLSARIAAIALVPITVIAFYSVWLRVEQYGLTPERVIGLAVIALGAIYSFGYAFAALWPGKWMRPLEVTNVIAAMLAVFIIMSLLTPIADPARLAVQDQVWRLRAGLIPVDKFDFDFLRFDASQYGREALNALAKDRSSPRAIQIAQKASDALHRSSRIAQGQPTNTPPAISPADLRAKIRVFPAGAMLPESFLTQDWTNIANSPAECVRNAAPNQPCEATFADIDRDNQQEILLRTNLYRIQVFRNAASRWETLGAFNLGECGLDTPPNFSAGQFQIAPSEMNELEVKGHRYRLTENCPPKIATPVQH
ncbi:MAG: DUF4153 domain-containing protein [Micropepsaceae bacterium]